MSSTYTLDLHAGQMRIMQEARRFNVVPCGRRFGKTTFIEWLVHIVIERKWFAAVFSKESNDVELLFIVIEKNYEPCIRSINRTKRIIYFKGGGRLDFFSVKDKGQVGSGRSRKYHLVIYDEVQKIDDDALRENFNKAVLPTLTDFKGSAFLFGTTNGKGSYLYELAKKGAITSGAQHDTDFQGEELENNPNWAFIRMPTVANPHISPEEVANIMAEMDELTAMQEYEAVFVDYGGNIWCYTLKDKVMQQKTFVSGLKADFTKPIYISFDFNKEPMTALAMQLQPTIRQHFKTDISIVKEFKLGGGGAKASIYDTCQAIREWIYASTGAKVGKWYDGFNLDGTERVSGSYPCHLNLHITGDASGNTADGRQRQPQTYYQIIKDELGLRDANFHVPKSNPYHAESYVQVNTFIQRHPHFKIDEQECRNLRLDMLRINANHDRTIAKKAGEATQADLLDNLRYLLWNFCREY